MAVFVRHESCPKCGSKDNRAVYSDGSAWCFGCHDYERAETYTPYKEPDRAVLIADDLCNDFPRHVVEWLARYDISIPEALKHGWKYSPKWDQLVFVWYDAEGLPLLSQSRNFAAGAKRKYFNQGSPADVLPIFSSNGTNRTLVVVEDAVSAAKISRQVDAMPCLGSYLPMKKMARLKPFYEQFVVWLDSDKYKEALEISTAARWLGIGTKVVRTDLDPKEHSDADIASLVWGNVL